MRKRFDPSELEPKNGDFAAFVEKLNEKSVRELKALQVNDELMREQINSELNGAASGVWTGNPDPKNQLDPVPVHRDTVIAQPEDAFKVHGLNLEYLKDFPTFREIAKEWMDFVGDDGILVAHNASFDISFINYELQGCGYPGYEWDRVIDTLEIARQKFPHSKVNLDALCKRFGVDNTSRTLHGALLDAQLLAEVYLELLGGQEPSMQLGEDAHRDSVVNKVVSAQSLKRQFRPARDFPLSAEDLAAHEEFMTNKIKDSVWNAPLETAPAESE